MNYATVSPWRGGDIASATKLNQMADNISVVAGLRDQRYYPYDSGADVVVAWNGDDPILRRPTEAWGHGKTHDAWILHNGDTLVVDVHIDSNVVNEFGVIYDYEGDNPQHFSLADGLNMFALSGSYYRYQPVRVYVRAVNLANPPGQPGGSTGGVDNSLWVHYVYTTDSNAPVWNDLPGFSDYADMASGMNAIIDATDMARRMFNQPIAGCYYWCDMVTVQRGFYGYLRRMHDQYYADLVIGPANSGDHAFLNINGENVWGKVFSGNDNSFDAKVTINFADMNNAPSEGSWYLVQFGYNGPNGAPDNGPVMYLWSTGEEPGFRFAGQGAIARWAEGTSVTRSELEKYSQNLAALNAIRRWQNMACRTGKPRANSPQQAPGENGLWGKYSAYRVHRWLAYENYLRDDGTRCTAQVEWRGAGRALQSFSLPTLDRPGFFDLESTPIRPGQYMRISGVRFAIQSPMAVGGTYV